MTLQFQTASCNFFLFSTYVVLVQMGLPLHNLLVFVQALISQEGLCSISKTLLPIFV